MWLFHMKNENCAKASIVGVISKMKMIDRINLLVNIGIIFNPSLSDGCFYMENSYSRVLTTLHDLCILGVTRYTIFIHFFCIFYFKQIIAVGVRMQPNDFRLSFKFNNHFILSSEKWETHWNDWKFEDIWLTNGHIQCKGNVNLISAGECFHSKKKLTVTKMVHFYLIFYKNVVSNEKSGANTSTAIIQ